MFNLATVVNYVTGGMTVPIEGWALTSVLGMAGCELVSVLWKAIYAIAVTVQDSATSVPEPPPTAYREFKRKYLVPARGLIAEILLELSDLNFYDWTMIVISLLLIWTCASLLLRAFKPQAYRMVLRCRGVCCYSGEALIPGSDFVNGVKPGFQVELYAAGLLMDTFLGYGLRIQNTLVFPKHLVLAAEGRDFIAMGVRGKVLLNQRIFDSANMSDVAYMPLSESLWTQIGASKAKLIAMKSTLANVAIFGPRGLSFGSAFQTKIRGLINYTGSTVPGYSGAGYTVNGQLLGMHLGTTNLVNMGVTALTLVRDLKNSMAVETAAQSAAPSWISTEPDNQFWDDEADEEDDRSDGDSVDEDLYDAYMRSAKGRGRTYDEWLELSDSEGESASAVRKELYDVAKHNPAARRVMLDIAKFYQRSQGTTGKKVSFGSVKFRAHGSVDGSDTVFAFNNAELDRLTRVESKLESLEKRVSALEGTEKAAQWISNVQAASPPAEKVLVSPPETKKVHSCSACNKKFTTVVGMKTHQAVVHVTGESAIKSDSQVLVGTKPATVPKNGKTSSTKSSSKVSVGTSVSSTGQKNATSQNDVLNKIVHMMQQQQRALNDLQKAISGRTGGVAQS